MPKKLHTAEETLIRIGEDGRRIVGRTEAEVQTICRTALAENPKSLILLAPRHSFITPVEICNGADDPQTKGLLLTLPDAIKCALVPGAATALLSAACANENTAPLTHGLLAVLPWASRAEQDLAVLVVVLMGESQLRWHAI